MLIHSRVGPVSAPSMVHKSSLRHLHVAARLVDPSRQAQLFWLHANILTNTKRISILELRAPFQPFI